MCAIHPWYDEASLIEYSFLTSPLKARNAVALDDSPGPAIAQANPLRGNLFDPMIDR